MGGGGPQVSANCLLVLREVDGLPALAANKRAVYKLLNRLKAFSEWAQCAVLELASHYKPADADEMFDIMNLLEDRLRHANSAVVLATVRLFLLLTLDHPDIHQMVYERIKTPMVTLAASGTGEVAYAVWSHLCLLVQRAPYLFALEFKQARPTSPPRGAVFPVASLRWRRASAPRRAAGAVLLPRVRLARGEEAEAGDADRRRGRLQYVRAFTRAPPRRAPPRRPLSRAPAPAWAATTS